MIRKINLIVACGVGNRVIGKDGVMPWHIPIDLKYFKARTTDNVVVMGRNTYESIGKPLPRRANFVVTRKDSHTIKRDFGLFVYNDLMAALESATTFKEKDVFVIGGANVYKQCMELPIDKLYITWVKPRNGDSIIEGDTFFPEIDKDRFETIDSYDYDGDDDYLITFTTLKEKDGYTKTN